jgi:hypothetical protein
LWGIAEGMYAVVFPALARAVFRIIAYYSIPRVQAYMTHHHIANLFVKPNSICDHTVQAEVNFLCL